MDEQYDAPKREYISNQTLQLELKAMRSEFRLWLVAAVVANSALSHVVLPPVVGFSTAILALGAVALKALVLR